MPDMLVQLLKLPPLDAEFDAMRKQSIVVRRVHSFECSRVRAFIESEFGTGWADEVVPGFSHQPTTVFIAVRNGKVLGFGAFDCTRRGFFGPTGVALNERGTGIGRALLIACLCGLREMGYVYGIIGGAGPTEFYERTVNAVPIPDSEPGIYTDMLADLGA